MLYNPNPQPKRQSSVVQMRAEKSASFSRAPINRGLFREMQHAAELGLGNRPLSIVQLEPSTELPPSDRSKLISVPSGRKSTRVSAALTSDTQAIQSPSIAANAHRRRLWTDSEIEQVATASLKHWEKGQSADCEYMARQLQRPVEEVQVMLRLMLQEDVLSDQKVHWPDHSRDLVRRWGALEFPECPVLAANRSLLRSSPQCEQRGCFSILRARPRPGERKMRIDDLTQPRSASAIFPTVDTVSSKIATVAANSEDTQDVESSKSAIDSTPLPRIFKATAVCDTREAATSTKSLAFYPPQPKPMNNSLLRRKSTAHSQILRAKIAQERRKQHRPSASATTTATATAKLQLNLSLPKQTSSAKASIEAVNEKKAVAYDGNVLGLAEAVSVAATAISKLPLDLCKLDRLDSDIDVHFVNVAGAVRRYVRGFVGDYVEQFFDVFYLRVMRAGGAVLVRKADSGMKLAKSELMKSLENEMQLLDALHGSVLDPARADLHFHMRFARAVQKCDIREEDMSWPNVNSYATAVYNRMLEDAHRLALESLSNTELRIDTFKRTHYMSLMAGLLTTCYVQAAGRHVFLQRVARCGYRPVLTIPAANAISDEADTETEAMLPWSDTAIRWALQGLLAVMLPHITHDSVSIALQRSVEIYNKTIVDFIEGQRHDLSTSFGVEEPQPVNSPPALGQLRRSVDGKISARQVAELAQWLADVWFDRLKRALLKALMADHRLRPVRLAEVRRWIAEDRAPCGKSVAFVLNTRLYTYLRNLGLPLSEPMWLYASAAASLRLISRACGQIVDPQLLAHVNMRDYTELFRTVIQHELTMPIALHNTHDCSAQPSELNHDTEDLEDSRIRLECLAQEVDSNRLPPPHAEPSVIKAHTSFYTTPDSARLDTLEREIISIRREIHGVADMRRDVGAILAMLRTQRA
ncbi:hypothetical protein COEREDRAFT_85420 [Coemansia reversa NRRL 1564]|uniref:Uncharacterized protein n=1 Tax=Coemansia reversa (strain ATCC 12441 / NRRL 1564) TaxID=763665 RepID=A0A2G5BHG8_COERN|nr:hypothetical protein COEREDRAFT_85420 [Coemansia reversa NRRL 1564]|eukprot:PIA18460.1 hypothetical protein COEREDRAFT_85420 [Coemansia reversa NRRL 1564]